MTALKTSNKLWWCLNVTRSKLLLFISFLCYLIFYFVKNVIFNLSFHLSGRACALDNFLRVFQFCLMCFWIDNVMIINKLKWNDLSVLSCKGGYEAYTKWKYDWTIHSGQKEASIKVYVSEMIMPFWVQCTLCLKWREFPEKDLTPAVIKSWKCSAPSCIITSNNKVKSKYSITNLCLSAQSCDLLKLKSLSDLDT